ncbi:CARDB domain-containing protein [Stigmatella erecta]|uniref:CARDB protein n=1 Tax=Stigmatella erecta TaxID=83460 RepID=A0A1I0L7R3_9BACT|nr:CARDB domain-containing protein [Stigmatella erecta]SEU35811.1 CARDB protein [Stigmatella erecta]
MQRRVGKAVIGMVAMMGAVGCGTPEETAETALAESLQAVAVTDGPDFIVKSVKGPVSMHDGADFTATVTVCNQGTQGGHTDIGLYLSVDAVISVPTNPGPYTDQPAGMEPSDFLEPGACQTLSVPGHASVPSHGAYYLGAVADPLGNFPEIRENNNTRTGNRLGIGASSDLIVSEVTGPTSAQSGEPFTASIRVCNQGTASGSAEVALYLSEDTVISVPSFPSPYSDQFLGMEEVHLGPGVCRTVSVPASVSSVETGAYYLGAVVDPGNTEPEFLEDNNAKAGSRLGLGSRPDFIVSKVTGPTSAELGQPFVASVSVCNQGTEGGETDVALYLSEDKAITASTPEQPGDALVAPPRPAGWLEPGQCRALSLNAYVDGVSAGAYYLGAAVNGHHGSPELIADNNTKVGGRFGVGAGADFVVTQVSGPTSADQFTEFNASVTVCNQGTREGSTQVEVYLSTDTTLTVAHPQGPMSDFLVGWGYVPSMAPGQCQTVAVTQGQVPGDGAYYLGAVVDPGNTYIELVEDNNAKTGGRLGVGDAPDFIVTQVSGPPSSEPGDNLPATLTVCNQGTRSGSTYVDLYLSQDMVIIESPFANEPEDALVASAVVENLPPGMCQTMAVQGNVPFQQSGAAYLGALLNPQSSFPELLLDNNTKVGPQIGFGHGPDFVVTKVTGPARVTPDMPLSASVTVCNQGTRGGHTDVALYLSEDAILTPPSPYRPSWEPQVALQSTHYLEPGGCQVLSMLGDVWLEPGAYYLAALANPQQWDGELIRDNNTKVGKTVSITH